LRITGWAGDQAGCGWYRLALPLSHLRTLGHQVTLSTRLTREMVEQTDVLIGQRIHMPHPTQMWQEIRKLSNRPLMVFELDDNLLEIPPTTHPTIYEVFANPQTQQRTIDNIRASDLVTTSTVPLAATLTKYHTDVYVLPNCIPAWLLDWEVPTRDGQVTIGWQGSDTHDMDWAEITGEIRRFITRNPQTELHTMGAKPHNLPRLPPPRHRHSGWTTEITEYYKTVDWDIALAPLRPHLFNQAKSALRVLEAAALGIPVVASDYGPYAEFVQHGQTGFLAKRSHQWGSYLGELTTDPELRDRMGKNAREQARLYTAEANSHRWLALYRRYLETR